MKKQSNDVLFEKLGYTFKDIKYLDTALTHRSASRNNNERLEFLGDGVLNCIIAAELFATHPKATEGELSRYRSALVKENTLAAIARELELGKAIRLGTGEIKSGGSKRSSILADAVEAIIGAIYLDGGYDQCRQCVNRIYRDRIVKLADVLDLKDPKTRLQELLQAQRLPLPEYELVDISGDAHERYFYVRCNAVVLEESTTGEGSSRRRAEQDAAAKALQAILNE